MRHNARTYFLTAVMGLMLMALLTTSSSTALAQEEEESEELGVAVLFPDNDLFDEYLELTEETTGLSEDEWAEEFEMHVLFIQFSSANGLIGQITNDIGFLDEMFAGTHDFVVYGTFEFPRDFPLHQSDMRVERGVVLFITDEYLVMVLIDLSQDGEITAFAIFPRVGVTTPLASGINLQSLYGIALLLQGVPQFNIVEVPTPPDEDAVATPVSPAACPEGLDKLQDVNITLTSDRSIATGSDTSGNL